ncbi:Arf GTPase activating protein [Hesseltinella vesiculosa]|uniref:Arf GTPase activating protein n=1 Tax=Hesseltinella vesiculosa TaxID=101127 RepID=A0A1X2GXT1_9FUNG|nr:Arf GTPase activating protein [Hesseltinella vesiculosa]
MPPLSKQERRDAEKLTELLKRPCNKTCFDCGARSPFFVDMTILTFICARCSGLVREAGHRIKSLSASKFSSTEVIMLDFGGNEVATKIWLHGYQQHRHDNDNDEFTTMSDTDVRALMRKKYFDRRWLNEDLLQAHIREMQEKTAGQQAVEVSPLVPSPSFAQLKSTSLTQLPPPEQSSAKPLPSLPSANLNQDLLLIDLEETPASPIMPLASPAPSPSFMLMSIQPPSSSTNASVPIQPPPVSAPFNGYVKPVNATPFLVSSTPPSVSSHPFLSSPLPSSTNPSPTPTALPSTPITPLIPPPPSSSSTVKTNLTTGNSFSLIDL